MSALKVWPLTKASTPKLDPRSAQATRCCRQLPGPASRGGPEAPMVTDGPFAEAAEIACGYYVFEAENLDDALALARDIPAAQDGAIEVRPAFHTFDDRVVDAPTRSGWRCCSSRRRRSTPRAHRSGRPKRRGTANSPLLRATTSSAVRLCTSRRRRPQCGFATARCCSPMGRSRRAPRSPRASTCCQPPTATRPSSWRRMIPASAVEVRQLAGVSGL